MTEYKEKKLDLSRYGYVPGDKFVAYVSSYTRAGKKKVGIRVYDVDVEKGTLSEKSEISITNSSYVTISHSGKAGVRTRRFAPSAFVCSSARSPYNPLTAPRKNRG